MSSDRCPWGYRLYRAGSFCKFEIGLCTQQDAVEGACDALAGGMYDRAEVTIAGMVVSDIVDGVVRPVIH